MTRLYMIRSKSEFFCAKVTFFKCQGFAMLSEKIHARLIEIVELSWHSLENKNTVFSFTFWFY